VDKSEAEKHKHLVKYFLEERRVLQELDHPFIMKLVRTFKTQDNIFFLTNFINGKGLNKYLDSKKSKSFRNKEETRFYISFLFVILDYLNSKGIAHRDLKPENIMINTQGYLQLIDFGTAKRIKDFTCTIIGTAYYISPEVLIGKGYSFSCDYWSIGILAFEIYYNYYPFGNEANEPMEVYRDVLKKDLSLPYNGDKSVNSFIKAMLNKKVSQRLSSLEKAKKHEFFKNFNWDDLIDLQMKPPYIPECLELKNFDNYKEKYITHLKKEKNKYKIEKSVNSYGDDDDTYGFKSNWADEF
jgi:cGMP-dependent protein kinase